MIQTWILRADLSPTDALGNGADQSVCGDYPLRNGACYVTLFRGPRAVFSAYANGEYPHVDDVGLSWLRRRRIRFGSYGDPAAVPADVWFRLAANSKSWTGYTRGWKQSRFQVLRPLMMASVDTQEEAWAARGAGWRTFRIRLEDEELLPNEAVCPASKEGGHRTDCADCGQCNGAREVDVRNNYVTIAHGSGARKYRDYRLKVLPARELAEPEFGPYLENA